MATIISLKHPCPTFNLFSRGNSEPFARTEGATSYPFLLDLG